MVVVPCHIIISFASVASLAGIDDQSSSNDDQLTITDTAVVINEDSDDVDFRVESDDNANMLVVDANDNRVLVGTSTVSAYANRLMTVGDAATADVSIEIRSDEHSQLIFSDGSAANDDSQRGYIIYDHTDENFKFGVNALEFMRAHSIGAITMPLQPAFLVTKSSDQSNIAINSDVTITFDTETFDQNADFASNTFTAPVTGRYQLNANIYGRDVDRNSTYIELKIKTSNRTHYCVFDVDNTNDSEYHSFNFSVLADMDANDTAFIEFSQSGGVQQTDIQGSHTSTFSGYLAC